MSLGWPLALDGLECCSHLIAFDPLPLAILKLIDGQLQGQVGETGGCGDWRQRVNAKQPSIANATKGEVSTSSDGWRQDEAELRPFSAETIVVRKLKVALCQRSALVDSVTQPLHECVGETDAAEKPNGEPIQDLKIRISF